MLPARAAAQEHAPQLDTTAVQAALQPDEIVFAFSLAEPDSFRWVISREHFVFDRIAGRTTIETAATPLRGVRDAQMSDVRAASKQLGAMLFDKISTADDRPVIVVPDGVLHDVRFELLELQGRMVSDRHSVSYAPSLDALVQSRRARVGSEPEMAPKGLALGLSLAAVLIAIAKVRRSAQVR